MFNTFSGVLFYDSYPATPPDLLIFYSTDWVDE